MGLGIEGETGVRFLGDAFAFVLEAILPAVFLRADVAVRREFGVHGSAVTRSSRSPSDVVPSGSAAVGIHGAAFGLSPFSSFFRLGIDGNHGLIGPRSIESILFITVFKGPGYCSSKALRVSEKLTYELHSLRWIRICARALKQDGSARGTLEYTVAIVEYPFAILKCWPVGNSETRKLQRIPYLEDPIPLPVEDEREEESLWTLSRMHLSHNLIFVHLVRRRHCSVYQALDWRRCLAPASST